MGNTRGENAKIGSGTVLSIKQNGAARIRGQRQKGPFLIKTRQHRMN